MAIAPPLVATSAAICLLIGLLHLVMTFYGPKLFPRDDDLRIRMHEASLVITTESSMWKIWTGVNASHGIGFTLFGAVYAYLALVHGEFLLRSGFLLSFGFLVLLGHLFLTKRYFFSVPVKLVSVATLLYAVAVIGHLVGV